VSAFDIANESSLPDLYYGAPIGLIGRYKQSGQAMVTITAEVLGQPFEQKVELNFADVNNKNPEIERMWAFHRVQELMNLSRKNGSNAEIDDKIVQLCEGYSIVSEYASFIVLENDAEYVRWSINRRNLNRSGRDRAAQAALRAELESLREDALAKLGPPAEKLVAAPSAGSNPLNANPTNPLSNPTIATPQSIDNSTAQDLNFSPSSSPQGASRSSGGGGGGGGAIDPITGLLALSVAGASAWAARRRKQV
jgi:Ca-activated chloride channel family protein